MKKSKAVESFCDAIQNDFLQKSFEVDPNRAKRLSLSLKGLKVDFSKQLWTFEILQELIEHHKIDADLTQKISDMFNGESINRSENRQVKHFLLRDQNDSYKDPDFKQVKDERDRFLDYAQAVSTDQEIKYLVNIGIGGSDLGPKLVLQALGTGDKEVFFASNIDPYELDQIFKKIDLNRTRFIVVSKTFGTKETLINAERVIDYLRKNLPEADLSRYLIGVTTNPNAAIRLGISPEQIFTFWDWVGGRYSLASAVGISIAMCLGKKSFLNLLEGMYEFDQSLRNEDLKSSLAYWHALSCVFNINYLNRTSQAVIAYSSRLDYFAKYLQQLIMESNGKSVTQAGDKLAYSTSPIIFGEIGTNSQHSFFQAIHQGTQVIPVDFIVVKPHEDRKAEITLVANALAQAAVLAFGTKKSQGLPSAEVMPGNRPSNLIMLENIDAFHLGLLIAFYEASTIIQGFIWNINSFDQWGVQLGKTVAEGVERAFSNPDGSGLDDSTIQGINFLR